MVENNRTYLTVSFGDVSEPIESAITEKHPNCEVRRAFTSRIEAKKIGADHISDVFPKLAGEGVTQLTVQPLHVINGTEFEIVKEELTKNLDLFQDVRLGSPLLTSERDYRAACNAIVKDIVPEVEEYIGEGTTIVLVGRGSDHYANSAYCQLQEMLNLSGEEDIVLTTVEGFPSYADTAKKLAKMGATDVSVVPFIVALGEEDSEEIAGKEEMSLRMILKAEGFKVKCIMKSLGERPAFQRLFADHADAAAILKKEQ